MMKKHRLDFIIIGSIVLFAFICVLVIPLPYLIFIAKQFVLMNSTMLFFYSGLFIYYVVTLLICLLLNYCVGKVQLGGQ